MAKSTRGFLGLALALAASAGASPGSEENRLDPALKLLYRAQRAEATLLAPRDPLALVDRLRGERLGRERLRGASRLLTLLVKYRGEPARLEEAGFRVQARAGDVFTGTLDPSALDRLATLEGLELAQASQRVRAFGPAAPSVPARSAAEAALAKARSRPAPLAASATGVLVAFVDTGVDVAHQDFRKPDGTTRIKYLLDFSDPGDTDDDGVLDGAGPYGGTLYTEADINAALAGGTLGQKDTTGHGTHGLSAAAGDDTLLPGIAPGADLVVVKATREDGSLAFWTADLVNALAFVDGKAAELGQPYVVNLSLGTLFSSHDGRSLEEQAIDALVGPGIAGKAAVVAAGNSSDNRGSRFHHFQGRTFVGLEVAHTLSVPAFTPNPDRGDDRVLLDVWYEGRDKQMLTVRAPASRPDCPDISAPFGEFVDYHTPCGDVFIANVGGPNPSNGDVEAIVLIDDWSGTPPAEGDWTIALRGEEIGESGVYHGWLSEESRLGAAEPWLSGNADNLYLVGKPGGAYHAITVGSFAHHDPATRFRTSWVDVLGNPRVDTSAIEGEISDFSSPGGTRDGRVKPELAAAGERVLGAVSKDAYPGVAPNSVYRFHGFPAVEALIVENTPEHAFGLLQGTSFSAPLVSGLAARILSEDPTLDAIQVRNILVNSARTDAQTGPVPNEEWGYGKADLTVGAVPGTLPSDLRITVDALPDGALDRQYNVVLTASGGALPYTWSLSSGLLPPGLTLEPRGFLTGKPSAAGSFGFTIDVADSSVPAKTDSRSYEVTIAAAPALAVVTATLPVATIDQPYEAALLADGGMLPHAWTLAAGDFPPGLVLFANGVIQGKAELLGTFNFTVQVQDALGAAAYRSLRIRVTPAGGGDWDPLGKTTPTVNAIAVDPSDPAHVLASTRNIDAVFETRNAGDSWQATSINNNLNTYANELRFSPSSAPWALTFGFDSSGAPTGRPYRFDAASGQWVLRPLPGNPSNPWGLDFDVAGGTYLSLNDQWNASTFLHSVDEGLSWSNRGTGCNGIMSLSVFRPDPSRMFSAGQTTCITEDGGLTWLDVSNLSGGGAHVRVSQQDPFDVVKAGSGAVWKSVDGGRNWAPSALPGALCCLDRSPATPSVVLAGTSEGVFKSSDGGQSFRPLPIRSLSLNVTSVAIDPNDADTFYVGSDQGVLASVDGGQSWTLKNSGIIRRTLSAISVSRAAPSDVLLVAAEGPYVSRTAGDAWTLSREGLDNLRIGHAVVSPADPNLFYLSNDDGVFRSDNRGVTWYRPDPSFGAGFRVVALEADPFDGNVVLASLSGTRGTYRSANRGQTWAGINVGLPFAEPTDLTFARDVPGRVYVAFKTRGVYGSANGGASWAPLGLNDITVEEVEPAPSSSGYLYARSGATLYFLDPAGSGQFQVATTPPARPINDIAVDANDPLTAWAGADHSGVAGETGGIYRTTDGGRTWARLQGILDPFDVVAVAAHPAVSGTLYAATLNAGVYRSTDGGLTWTELGNYGTVADLTNLTVQDPGNPFRLFAGTEGYGVQVSVDRGRTFLPRVSGLTNFHVNAIAFDPDGPTVVYAGTDAGIFKSTDSGGSWAFTGQTTGEVTDLATDNDGTARRIWGTIRGEGVAFSGDGGATFSVSTTGLASLDLTSLEVETKGTARRIWATMRGADGVVYSDDLGQTWTSAAGNGLTDRNVNDLAIQEGAARRIWGTADSGVFYTTNDGLSWTSLSLGLPSGVPVTSVAIDPNTGELLVSLFSDGEGGVYRGGNVRGIWSPFSNGLGELKVRRLTSDRGHVVDATTMGTTFYAATAGDGVYASELRTGTADPLEVATAALPDGKLRTAYSAVLEAEGGTPPYTWSIAEGALPSGITLEGAGGALGGEPGQEGLFAFTVQVSDANSRTAQKALGITVRSPDVPTLSIDDASLLEGDAGSTDAVFTVALSPASAGTVTVGFATGELTASAGADYVPAAGTLTFDPGATSRTITVSITGDTAAEADELFSVDLSGATGATIVDPQGLGTIRDDDSPPRLLIGDATVVEGDAGTTDAVFNVTLSRTVGFGVTVQYATADGTASAPADYLPAAGTLTFLAGTTAQAITVPVNGDTAVEPDETFVVNLSDPVNATIDDGVGQATIPDDDGIPTLSIGDVTVVEGAPYAVFPVTLSRASTASVQVGYATSDGTALAGTDYVATEGVVVYPPGERVRTVPVPLTFPDDDTDQEPIGFFMSIGDAHGAEIADAQATATLVDDDTRVLSIDSLEVVEGTDAVFTVSLDAPSVRTITVDFTTVPGTAAEGTDYPATAGTLTFPPGSTAQPIPVPVPGNTVDEPDETFRVLLSNPTNAMIANRQGPLDLTWKELGPAPPFCTLQQPTMAYDSATDRLILNGGYNPCLGWSDVWVLENALANDGTSRWRQLSPLGTPPPGRHSHGLAYDPGTNRLIVHGGVGGVAYRDTWVLTGANGLGQQEWIQLPDYPGNPRSSFATAYDAVNNRLIVFSGEVQDVGAVNDVWVLKDANGLGSPEWIKLAPTGAAPHPRHGRTAAYDPGSNRLIVFGGDQGPGSPSNPSGHENDLWVLTNANGLGGVPAWIRLAPQGAPPLPRAFHALAYDPRTNQLYLFGGYKGYFGSLTGHVALGDTWLLANANGVGGSPRWIEAPITGPAPRYLGAEASGGSAALVVFQGGNVFPNIYYSDFWVLKDVPAGTATILDDDDAPTVSVNDAGVAEGNSGPTDAVFTVSLSNPSERDVEVSYSTADGSARSGPDYVATSGSVTIPAAQTSATFAVPVKGDVFLEGDETFFVNLTSASNATIGDGQGLGTILNDDAPTADGPVPALQSLDPVATAPGGPGFQLRLFGANFLPSSVVRWNGASRATSFISARELRASILAADVATAGVARVSVFTPAPGGGGSESLPFVVAPASPIVSFARTDLATGSGSRPIFVAAADLDGDGHPDLATANAEGDTVSVFLGNGDGTFAARVDYPGGDHPSWVHVADLDKDGDPDLAVANYYSFGVSVFLGNGDGTFAPRTDHPAGVGSLHAVLSGDFNGDGLLDLVAGGTSGVSVLLRNGDGTYLSPGYVSSPGYDFTMLQAGDFNGDGRLDLLGAAHSTGVLLLAGNGEGVFTQSFVYGYCCYNHRIAAGDFNRDGALDFLFVPHANGPGVSLFVGNNAGVFSGAAGSPGLPSPYFPAVADFNADGSLDSAWTNLNHASVSLLPASFAAPTEFAVGQGPYGAVAADFNGDGRMDVATANYTSNTVSILTNAPPPDLTVSDVSVSEGNLGGKDAVFTVTLTPSSVATVTVSYATADGTAQAGADYVAASGALAFLPGETSKTVTVIVFGDTAYEPDETFFLDLSGPNGALLADPRGQGTIVNDESGFLLSVNDTTVAEGDSGSPAATFTVSMPVAVPEGGTVTVNYTTADGSATAGEDYQPTSGTLTFTAGQSSRTIVVPVIPDDFDELDETFTMNLSNAEGAVIVAAQGTATILDDDDATVSIGDATVTEGDSGLTNASFEVTLSAPSARAIEVDYATADDTARAGPDYVATSGAVSFPPGTTSVVIAVPVRGDLFLESDERFFVNLAASAGVSIADGQGRGTILNDDVASADNPVPALHAVDPFSAVPGSDGFELRVQGSSLLPSSVLRWNGADRATTFINARELRAQIPASDLLAAGAAHVSVFSPGPGGGRSEPLPFVVGLPTVAVSFSRSDIAAGGGPRFVAAGDVNRDGRSDLVVASYEGGSASVFLGNGDGTFASPVGYATGAGPSWIALADLDQDGDLDLAVANRAAGTVSVLLGDGAGGFAPRTDYDAGPEPSSVVSGDFNADGKLDLAVSHWTGQGVSALLGNGDGTFLSPGYDSAVSSYGVSMLVTGEFNGDGRLDLLAAAQDGLHLLAGNNEGVFTRSQAAGWCCYSEWRVATGEFNRDGALDFLLLAANPGWGATLFAGNNTGGFSGYAGSPGLPSPYYPVVADFNADGVLDSAWTNLSHASVSLLLGSGNYSFQNPTEFAAGQSPLGAAAADFTGDGRVDLAVANAASNTISIFVNTPPPALSVSNTSVVEGNALQVDAAFTVTLDPPSVATVTVGYATADGTAAAGSDYVYKTGSLAFLPGETTKTVPVSVFGDTLFEPDETFFLNLSGANGADIAVARGRATIANDDTGFALSVSDVSVTEGDSGPAEALFTVSMPVAVPAGQSVTVDYSTADGSARAGFDYQAVSGTLTFIEGQSSRTVPVPLLPDSTDESDETFTLTLANPSGALIVDGQGQATITDDDPQPNLSIDDVTVVEGGSVTTAVFTVSLAPASGREVRVRYATADGTALAGADYVPASGILTFEPGMTARTVSVTVTGETVAESDETFFLDLDSATNATVADGRGRCTIRDDDTFSKAEIKNPPPGAKLESSTVTFMWSAGNGASGYWLTIESGPGSPIYNQYQGTALSRTVSGLPTDGRTLHVRLWTLLGAEWLYNDYYYAAAGAATSALTIDDVTVVEEDAGSTSAVFTVTLSPAAAGEVTVAWATGNGTATAGSDYAAASGTLVFPAGETVRTLEVAVSADLVGEPDETFFVLLSRPTGASIGDRQGQGTILNDDPSSLSVSDTRVVEGRSRTRNAVFTVTLSPPVSVTVGVDYATVDGSATAGSDYVAASGRLSFAPGETTRTVAVPVIGDSRWEPDETFTLRLGNPEGAPIGDGEGLATIVNDDFRWKGSARKPPAPEPR